MQGASRKRDGLVDVSDGAPRGGLGSDDEEQKVVWSVNADV